MRKCVWKLFLIVTTAHGSGGTLYKVSAITIHPNYNPSTIANDIAVLKLSTPLTLSSNVAIIAYATTTPSVSDGQIVNVAGWGTTSEGYVDL